MNFFFALHFLNDPLAWFLNNATYVNMISTGATMSSVKKKRRCKIAKHKRKKRSRRDRHKTK